MSTSPGPVTLITGAASGIGCHLVTLLDREGHRVWATGHDTQALRQSATASGWSERVRIQPLDVTREADWDAAMHAVTERDGPLDILLNNAGVLQPAWVHEIEADDIDRHLAVNVRGVILGTRAAARVMLPAGQGHIINIASLAGLAPIPGISLYSASKFAVRGFTLAAATELQSHGVHVTCVMPDAVQTPMLDLQTDYEEAAMTFSGRRPLTTEDIGRAIRDVVLPRRPLEIALPLDRGLMARIGGSVPGLSRLIVPALRRRGRERQEGARRSRGKG